jgi:cold-inducible RNA-binding protein
MNNKVYVGNVAWTVTNEDLTETFTSFGKVTQAAVVMDRETNRSRGFAFVTFESDAQATAAIEGMDGQDLKGRNIRVSLAQQKAPGGGGRDSRDSRDRDNRDSRGGGRY